MKNPIKCLRSQSFWLLLFINGVGTGSGLTLLNNLGQQARPQSSCLPAMCGMSWPSS